MGVLWKMKNVWLWLWLAGIWLGLWMKRDGIGLFGVGLKGTFGLMCVLFHNLTIKNYFKWIVMDQEGKMNSCESWKRDPAIDIVSFCPSGSKDASGSYLFLKNLKVSLNSFNLCSFSLKRAESCPFNLSFSFCFLSCSSTKRTNCSSAFLASSLFS